jgi:hypothetical protein
MQLAMRFPAMRAVHLNTRIVVDHSEDGMFQVRDHAAGSASTVAAADAPRATVLRR